MRSHPSKPQKRRRPTRRERTVSADGTRDPWNVPHLQQWARRAPLVGVFDLARAHDRDVLLVSLNVRGAYGKVLNTRQVFGLPRLHVEFETRQQQVARQGRYVCNKMLERVMKETGQPVRIQTLPDFDGLASPPPKK